MTIDLEPGIRYHKEIISVPEQSARAFGSGLVDVFATPAMIALMENTALESIHTFLPAGYTTVGTEINVKHLKATLIGMKVTGESFLKEVKIPKLIFEVHAWDEKGLIGIGTHTRVIVEEKVFMEKLK
jgi:fluoroacetyl-CoA thioesterase